MKLDQKIVPDKPKKLSRPDGEMLAYHRFEGEREPGLLWLGGFKSDMDGTKAMALDAWARKQGHSYIRFDYFGHGASSGDFAKGTLSRWRDDTLAVVDELTNGPQILIGSSMGGWLALLAALAHPEQVKALVLIAPAPDFTEDLMWAEFSDAVKAQLKRGEPYSQPSDYDDAPYPISPNLIWDGREHLILRNKIAITCPVRILHGMEDPDVPWQRSLTLCEKLASTDVQTTFIKSGDHRLSTETDLALLTKTLESLV